MINTELFPYETLPIRLEFGEKKNITVCHFQCQEHLDKYLDRYKLDKRTIKIDYRDEKPIKSGKTNKTKVRQGTGEKHTGSTSRSKGSTKKLDASGTIGSTSKSKSRGKKI